ncbi:MULTISPECIES: hypothetical protein [Sorangium]|uniref:Uncharacterized protein n=1 Tax=Sorangium atrum TaxID=2995308 RepID=A0ABT5CAJ1_9BACT|nr:hypothetical protein [Sorangium aterium]MDC0683454.1 hypothetical protein [Sorangium aterium]
MRRDPAPRWCHPAGALGVHAGFRAEVRAIALDYADQMALEYASF